MYRDARKRTGLSLEEAAFRLHVGIKTLQNYEHGVSLPPPEVALAMGREYKTPALTMAYCRRECAIGRAYCYELLNNVDTSPTAILTKYRQEEAEAHEALENLALLFLNKKGRHDCTADELEQIKRWALELLDLEHVIETLKLRLWDFLPVDKLVQEHNRKCVEKRYYDPRQPELKLAG